MNTKKYLLKADEIVQMQGQSITHFLNPNATRLNKSLGDTVGMNHLGFHIITVEAGKESTEYHKHHYEEEAIYVLSGKATAIIEGDRYLIEAGDFIGLPRNEVAHTIINDSKELFTCIVVGQRLTQDVADYPNQAKRLYRNNGELNLVDFTDVQLPTLQANRSVEHFSPEDIIDFWYSDDMRKAWFSSTPYLDFTIRERFELLWREAKKGKLDSWQTSSIGCLALVILFDQLPLNMFRGKPESFETEQLAVKICKYAIQNQFDLRIPDEQLAFLYMPLMHSENMDDQNLSVEKFTTANLEGNIRFAKHHRKIIQEFERFPHRNRILDRESTEAEIEYLTSDRAFTG